MLNGLTSVAGLFVLYAPIVLIGMVLAMATLARLGPMLHTKS